jgi:DNA-binding CsgD family transcriptional regulator
VRTLSLLAFCFFFGISALGVFLADRLVRTRGQAFTRSYTWHLALWNAHALVQIMQFILGTAFLPPASWEPLAFVTGPVVSLLLAASLYFLVLFAVQLAGRRLPRMFPFLYGALWSGLLLVFALNAGGGPSGPNRTFLVFYNISFFVLKTGVVFGVIGYLLFAARNLDDVKEKRSLRGLVWTYLAGFLLFQMSVGGQVPLRLLPGHDYFLALIQIGYHFPVLAALGFYARRRAAARANVLHPAAAPGGLLESGLSPRETEIIGLVMRGFSNKEVEHVLFISVETVKKHLSSIYRKLGVKNRLQLSLLIQKKP